MRYLIALLVLLLMNSSLQAQTSKRSPDYNRHPYWIEMMDDTLSNYFTAIHAYDEFWKNREKPLDEEETMGMKGATKKEEKEKGSWLKRLFGRDPEKEARKYTYQCKRFEHWKIMMQPYVQEDGRILYPSERLEIWKNARQ